MGNLIIIFLCFNLFYIQPEVISISEDNFFVRFQSGFSTYSSDTLGNGIFLSLNLLERIHRNWFAGIEFNHYFRKKDRASGIWIPEYRVIENWLNISSLKILLSWGEVHPRVALKIGSCYIYGKKIILGLSPSPYVYSIKKFKPVFDIEISDVLWLPKLPFGITLGVSGGIILLKDFYGEIGAGIIYKPVKAK